LPWLGLLILFSCFIVPVLYRKGDSPSLVLRQIAERLSKDPVFFIGLAFLALLMVQWINTGRQLVFDADQNKWLYTPPRVPWLPSSVTEPDAREMLVWFFPAWSLALALRSGLLGRRSLRLLYGFMVCNAALLALFGLIQRASGTRSIYWLQPLDCYFFASFGYPNHAGAFFTLMFCLAAGLLAQRLLLDRFRGHWRWLILWSACSLFCLLGATLSLSRAAILLSWSMAAFVAVYIVKKTWRVLRPVQRLRLIAVIAAMALLACFLIAASGKESIAKEMATLHPGSQSANLMGGEWALLRSAAFKMWQDHPGFGVGGWGFSYLLGWYIPSDRWSKIRVGAANVHNDALQFLAEFGSVGAGLIAAAVGMLLLPVLKTRLWEKPLPLIALLGLCATVLHSMIDLPFRSPAILYSWLAILAALPIIVGNPDRNHRETRSPTSLSVHPIGNKP
jgi:O-antigen ligase